MRKQKIALASSNSWIKIYRKFLKWEWYDDINVKVLFLHCLLKANYKDKKWHGIEVKRGSFLTTIRGLAKETGLTPMQIRTALNKLKTTHEITQSSNANYTVITISNYEKYQTNNTLNNKPVTHQQHTDNTPITHTIEYIEENIEERDRGVSKDTSISSENSLKGKMEILLKEDTILELSKALDIDQDIVKEEVEKMVDWLKAKGKRYKDYKAFARNWLRRIKIEKKDSDTNIKFFNKKL